MKKLLISFLALFMMVSANVAFAGCAKEGCDYGCPVYNEAELDIYMKEKQGKVHEKQQQMEDSTVYEIMSLESKPKRRWWQFWKSE